MTDVSGILDAIDNCLRDDPVSVDAMRWNPVGMQWNPVGMRPVRYAARSWQLTGISRADLLRLASSPLGCYPTVRRHRGRCPYCNPAGNPPPLPYGHQYRRRQKARRRRRRR
jgi:hypothetical protein